MSCRAVEMALGSEMGVTGNAMGCRGNGKGKRLGLRECSKDTEGCGAAVGRWSGGLVARAGVSEGEQAIRAYGIGRAYCRDVD